MRVPAGRRAPWATAVVLGVALLTAGCHVPGTSSGSSAGAARLSPVTVAASPDTADAPLYLAVRDGLFGKAGLHVTVRSYSSTQAEMSSLRAGSAGVVAADYADALYAQSITPDLLVVADGYDAAPNVMEVLALPSARITMPSQLIGKTIGTPVPDELPFTSGVPYSLDTLATQSVLLTDGVQPTQVRWKPLAPGALLTALKTGRVNAIVATEPLIFQAESQLGATEVVDSLSGQTAGIPLSGYFTTRAFASAHARALRVFRSVLLQAQAEAASGSTVRTVLAAHMSTETADMVTLGVYPTSLNASGIQQVANLMYQFGMVPEELDVAALIFR